VIVLRGHKNRQAMREITLAHPLDPDLDHTDIRGHEIQANPGKEMRGDSWVND